jgi:hypothetical protein
VDKNTDLKTGFVVGEYGRRVAGLPRQRQFPAGGPFVGVGNFAVNVLCCLGGGGVALAWMARGSSAILQYDVNYHVTKTLLIGAAGSCAGVVVAYIALLVATVIANSRTRARYGL